MSASGRHAGKFERAMYGTRDTPVIWQDHLRETLLEMKFKESVTHSGVFQHESRYILLCVHVDDLLCTSLHDDLTWLDKQLLKTYELEKLLMGDDNDKEERELSISEENWNWARKVSACGQIGDACFRCCESWEWSLVEVSPRR